MPWLQIHPHAAKWDRLFDKVPGRKLKAGWSRRMQIVDSLIPFFEGWTNPLIFGVLAFRAPFVIIKTALVLKNTMIASYGDVLYQGSTGCSAFGRARENDLHDGGRYLSELRGLGRAAVVEVRVSTSSRSDLLSRLQAEMDAQGNNQLRRIRRRDYRSYCGRKI
ncbi:hypothetical protein ARMGADRAFT_1023013 [Armillaria gallica]|uniref:Uncharacterized protein n=1 Tax=Armillaria gallica TaxID=47427 RepID=A0A2H3ENW4_ARMGA|nr:hypothetical protein ARMGADRAFT_1023013 [Armillaria gallica]